METTIIAITTFFLALALVAYAISAYITKDHPTIDQQQSTYTQQELDNIELAQQLYNKDLRQSQPTKRTTKSTKSTKSQNTQQ